MSVRICMVLLAIVIAIGVHGRADEAPEFSRAEPAHPIQFEGKVVLLSVDKSSALEKGSQSSSLIEARLVNIGDRHFIIGKLHAPEEYLEDYPHVGAITGYPWENVESFMLMDLDQYDDYVEAYRRRHE